MPLTDVTPLALEFGFEPRIRHAWAAATLSCGEFAIGGDRSMRDRLTYAVRMARRVPSGGLGCLDVCDEAAVAFEVSTAERQFVASGAIDPTTGPRFVNCR
jgi:hypothetical protein